jgi:hypothetical protein
VGRRGGSEEKHDSREAGSAHEDSDPHPRPERGGPGARFGYTQRPRGVA